MNNINNKLVTREDVNRIINSILCTKQIEINYIETFQQAFVHKSFMIKESFIDEEDNCCSFILDTSSNERLEFLGDSVLNMVTAEYLFLKFPDKEEGFLTKMRTKLVRNTQLSHMGEKLGFNEFLLISNQVEKINGRNNPRLIEDVYESFIAALYKDQGHQTTKEFIFSCYEQFVDLNYLVDNNDNFKDMLLRYFQLNLWSHPVYNNILVEGTGVNKVFTTVVLVKMDLCESKEALELDDTIQTKYNVHFDTDYMIGEGKGKTKKESEQNASRYCLEYFKVPNNF